MPERVRLLRDHVLVAADAGRPEPASQRRLNLGRPRTYSGPTLRINSRSGFRCPKRPESRLPCMAPNRRRSMNMTQVRSITISGDLGSGKTTISEILAERLQIRRIGVGDIYRKMAEERGMTAIQLNLHSMLDDAVDTYIDSLQARVAESGERVVLDSRLGWHFFRSAFKVYLTTDPMIAARRVLSRLPTKTESYGSILEARDRLQERSHTEQARFLERYGVDKTILRNYDLICDTSDLAPEITADNILAVFQDSLGAGTVTERPPFLLLSPQRIYPTEGVRELRGLWGSDYVANINTSGPVGTDPIAIGYSDSCFYVIDGHWRLSAAIQSRFQFVSAYLRAERDEEVVGGISAQDYFRSETSLSMIYDWDAAHDIELQIPPHLQAQVYN
jgi:CMP/dCMP kinase